MPLLPLTITGAKIFSPLGFGDWKMTVATVTGLIAKENVVATFGQLFLHVAEVSEEGEEVWAELAASLTPLAGYAFLVFNLLCAPCFAAIGAIKREMNNARWTWFAIGYQCGFAYAVALMINQFGNLFSGNLSSGDGIVLNVISLVAAVAVFALFIYMLFIKKYKEATKLTANSGK